jgi:trigger factor
MRFFMQVSIETTTGLERRLIIGVPAQRVDSEVEARLRKAANSVKINGFRPGKVPLNVVRQRFGLGVRQEVLGEVMSQSFYEAVQKEKLRPAGSPAIEPKRIEPGHDIEFVATFEVYPEIEVADFSTISVEKPVAEVTGADIDDMIDTLRNQQAKYEEASKAAELGDQVVIDFRGTRNGEAFEGGSAEGTSLVLGSNRMIPGFEEGIVGMSAGESRTLALTFPEDYHNEELRGAAVEFAVTVHAVKAKQLPALDADFFRLFGVENGDEAAFRKEVADNMQRELKNALKNKVKEQVMDGLLAANAFDVPKSLIKQEIDALRQQMLQQFGGAAAQFDTSLLPDDMFRERAQRRVALGLLLAEVIKKAGIKTDPARVRSTVEELASTYQNPEQVVNWYYSNKQQLAGVESLVLEDMAVEKILESAKVAEKPSSYKEVMARN